jgi:hypothetical protein
VEIQAILWMPGLREWVRVIDYLTNDTQASPGGAKRIPGPAIHWRAVWIPLRRAPEQVRGNCFLILFKKSARAARPRPENHAGIRPDWTCLVKGAKRRCAVRTLDETSPVWRPAWQGFQGWLCPARACEEIQLILLMLGLPEWVPVTVYFRAGQSQRQRDARARSADFIRASGHKRRANRPDT